MRHRKFTAALALSLGVVLAAGSGTGAASALSLPGGWFIDGFSSASLSTNWSFEGEDESAWSLSDPRGSLTLTTRDASFYETDNRPVNIALRSAPKKSFDLIARLGFDPQADYEQAGLVLWAGVDDYVQLSYSHQGGLALLAGLESQGRASFELVENTIGDELFLRIGSRANTLDFAYSADGLRWTPIGQKVVSHTAYPRVGVFSSASGSGSAVPARFDFVSASPYLRLPPPKQPALPPDSKDIDPSAGFTHVEYTNPVQDWTSGDPATADPTVARGPDGAFYMVGSESEYTFSEYHALPIFRSTDLVHWEYQRDVFPNSESYPEWVEDTLADSIDFWAPDIAFHRGKMYVYYGATQKSDPNDPVNEKAIGVAVADSPTAPFTDRGTPIITGSTFRAIDQQVFTDTDGDRYIYWGSAFYPILGQRLSADGMSVTGPIIQVLPSHQGSSYIFDTNASLASNRENLIEAPWVVKRGKWYYMYYSGPNCCGPGANYSVAVARSTSPLGPFEKQTTNPILEGNERVLAPGHNALITDDAGQDWMVYHGMDAVANRVGDASRRNLYIDRVRFEDGWPIVNGPTTTRVADGPIIAKSRVSTPAPRPVSSLNLSGSTPRTVSVEWTATPDAIAEYRVYQNGVAVSDLPLNSRSFTFEGLADCTAYAFSVRPVTVDGRLGSAGGRVETKTTGCPEGSATDRAIDRTTAGNWIGTFGGLGYVLAGDATKEAPGVNVTPPGSPFTWAQNTPEKRALQRSDGSGRFAGTWFGSTVPVSVSVPRGEARRVTLYMLDWDTPGQRRQSITVTDLQGNALDQLSSTELAAFDGGTAVSWTVTGEVTITSQVEEGANSVIAAVFIDSAS